MTQTEIKRLREYAKKIRLGALECVFGGKSGHPGGSLSAADILSYLYFKELNIDPENPHSADRDRFVLSKGHACPALYSALANRGYFSTEELKYFRTVRSHLQGHPDMKGTIGVDMSTGSLGMGLSAACGMAISAKITGKNYRVYCMTGDGELQEGQIWEAAMFASHYKLDNLIVFVDSNGLQIDGKVTKVMSPEPIDKRFEAFGFYVQRINGHDFEEIDRAVTNAKAKKDMPSVIICNTVKGKGVSFMEDKASWHGVAPTKEEYEAAVKELAECEIE